MDLSIHGMGGSYTPGRKPLRRGKKSSAPPPEHAEGDEHSPAERVYEMRLPEQSRAEIAGIEQALETAETAASVASTAMEALDKLLEWLLVMEQQAAPAAGMAADEGDNKRDLPARQRELERAREEFAKLARSASFGKLRLLDGSLGCSGKAFGEGLAFVTATARTRSSPPDGFPVEILQSATRAEAVGESPLAAVIREQTARLVIEADGKQAVHYAAQRESLTEVVTALREHVRENGLEVTVQATPDGRLRVSHSRHGSAHCFTLKSSVPGLFSMKDGRPRLVNNGRDVAGLINGEPAFGEGEVLTGCAGNKMTDGLSVRVSGRLPAGTTVPPPPPGRKSGWDIGLDSRETTAGFEVGRVILAQQPLVYRFGPGGKEEISIRLNSMRPEELGLEVANESGFDSLAAVKLGSPAEAADALLLIRRGSEEVGAPLQRLTELSERVLAGILAKLRVQAENVSALHTNIADPGLALRVVRALSNQMHAEGRLALSAQEHPLPGAVIRLLSTNREEERRNGLLS